MNRSMLNSYSDVFALSEEELRALLFSGDEPVQVWASWALGMKINGTECPSEVSTLMDGEPPPGVRQNLLVFLAGNGNDDLVEAYARNDPNASVRAAACNLIARVSANIHERNYLLEELLTTDKSIDVREMILNGAARDRMPIALEILRNIIFTEEPHIQAKVLDVISVSSAAYSPNSELLSELNTWSNNIHSDVYEQYCNLSYNLVGGEQVLLLATTRPELSLVPIQILIKNGFRTTWKNLDKPAKVLNINNVPIILELLEDDFDQGTVVWLMQIMASSISGHSEKYDYGYSELCNIAMPRLYSMLLESVQPCKTEYAIPVLELVQSYLNYAESPDPDDTWNDGDNTAAIQYYNDFVTKLERWS